MKTLRVCWFVGLTMVLAATPAMAQIAEDASESSEQSVGPDADSQVVSESSVTETTVSTGDEGPGQVGSEGNGGGYSVRLRALERSVNELKERVFMTKRRLSLLKETVLGGVIGASRAVIKHQNDMGSSFRLIKAVYALDGVQIMSKSDSGGTLADMQAFDIYNGAIQPGSHTLSVQLVYQGSGFGIFSYLKSYKFNVKSSHTFVAGEGKATVLTVVGYEKGGVSTKMEDKPAVEFRVNLVAPNAAGTEEAE